MARGKVDMGASVPLIARRCKRLLAWYDRARRVLPWRALAGQTPNPYHVWLSEIMLQQTTVVTVGPYFDKFIRRWPTLQALAAADPEEIRQMWAGLGYYRRARGLHACARVVCADWNGALPSDEDALLGLPGIGPYTAAAVRAIAFDQKANVVDGNVERVMARLYALGTPMPKGKAELRALAAAHLPKARFGDYAQALMDLGATVCTPRAPKCDLCPWQADCAAHAAGDPETYPRRVKDKAKPVRRGHAFVLSNPRGAVALRQRPAEGLLADMIEVPSSFWREGPLCSVAAALREARVTCDVAALSKVGTVRHVFTHFTLDLEVWSGRGKAEGARWVAPDALAGEALPSLMRKILKKAIG